MGGLTHEVHASCYCYDDDDYYTAQESPLSSGEGLGGNLQPSTTSFEQAPLSSGEGPARILEPSTPAPEISVADLLDNLPPPNGVPDNAGEDLFPYGNNGRIKVNGLEEPADEDVVPAMNSEIFTGAIPPPAGRSSALRSSAPDSTVRENDTAVEKELRTGIDVSMGFSEIKTDDNKRECAADKWFKVPHLEQFY
ncbi:uncharacterized protein LOC135826706 [Sycon ciliatum]|uniref:uncharacterized protein LOC135826706 n=1 Tax=Sycon ciliatum TaxID=27933 RepID=UPI0031F684AF